MLWAIFGALLMGCSDEENLVTEVRLSSDKKRLEFKVDGSTIRQGNAVVAISKLALMLLKQSDIKLGMAGKRKAVFSVSF